MADCHASFLDFNIVIALSSTQKGQLRISRDAVRSRIRRFFREKQNGFLPKFHGQGSFIMNTIIDPIDSEFDVDDGIYFLVEQQPAYSVGTFHNWIYAAVDGHTQQKPIDKQTCVRLVYAGQYHLDLPIYYVVEGQCPRLAHKSKGWIDSDPREFIKWFNKQIDENGQLKRIVRYLKAWSDYRAGKLPSGLIFTILVCNNISFHDRDDLALYQTLVSIKNSLDRNFVCYRPTTPTDEDLLANYSKTNKDYFLEQLDGFIASAEKALRDETSQKDACKAWQQHFGNERFPFESEEFIEDSFKVHIQYNLKIDCKVSQKGYRPHLLRQMFFENLPLLRDSSLEFHITDCNVPKPFQVKWKVRNVGKEAIRRKQIRGQILNDGGNHRRVESSHFHGSHFVECYIVKENVCVARSKINVPISN